MKHTPTPKIDLKLYLEFIKDEKALNALSELTGDPELIPLKKSELRSLVLNLRNLRYSPAKRFKEMYGRAYL